MISLSVHHIPLDRLLAGLSAAPIELLEKATSKKLQWIQQYTRADGTVVPAHQAWVHVADDHDDAKVLGGQGTYSQKVAHKQLSGQQWFQQLPDHHKVGVLLHHATAIQDEATAAAALSVLKKDLLSGGKAKGAGIKAFQALPDDKAAELIGALKAKGVSPEALLELGKQHPAAAAAPAAAPEPQKSHDEAPTFDKPLGGATVSGWSISNSDPGFSGSVTITKVGADGKTHYVAYAPGDGFEIGSLDDEGNHGDNVHHAHGPSKALATLQALAGMPVPDEAWAKFQSGVSAASAAAPVKSVPAPTPPPAPAPVAAPPSAPAPQASHSIPLKPSAWAAFTFSEGTSNKFWAITVAPAPGGGYLVATRYGKIGAAGQTTTKHFASQQDAQAERTKAIASKKAKGYGWSSPESHKALAAPLVVEGHAKAAAPAAPPAPVAAAPAAPAAGSSASGTEPADGWQKVGGQLGSNSGFVAVDGHGQKWYVKTPKSEDHARSELLASKLYEAAGVKAAQLKAVTVGGKLSLASKWEDGTQKVAAGSHAGLDGARDGFAVDAWLANWDALGVDNTNIQAVGGKASRIDVGGSLGFRAQGAPKGDAFGTTVGELQTMRDPKKAAQAAAVFGGMSDADVAKSIAKVTALSDEAIGKLVQQHGPGDQAAKNALALKLIKRKEFLAGWASNHAVSSHGEGWDKAEDGSNVYEHHPSAPGAAAPAPKTAAAKKAAGLSPADFAAWLAGPSGAKTHLHIFDSMTGVSEKKCFKWMAQAKTYPAHAIDYTAMAVASAYGVHDKKLGSDGKWYGPAMLPQGVAPVTDPHAVQAAAIALHDGITASASAPAEQGPKDGETKQGADGTLVFKDGHWHKQAEAPKPARVAKVQAVAPHPGLVPSMVGSTIGKETAKHLANAFSDGDHAKFAPHAQKALAQAAHPSSPLKWKKLATWVKKAAAHKGWSLDGAPAAPAAAAAPAVPAKLGPHSTGEDGEKFALLIQGWKAAIASGMVPQKAQAEAMVAMLEHSPDEAADHHAEAVSQLASDSGDYDPEDEDQFEVAIDRAKEKADKLHQHALNGTTPAPKVAKVQAAEPAPAPAPNAGQAAAPAALLEKVLASKLPATNSNAGPVNKKLDAIHAAASKGDLAALQAMTFGSNNYALKAKKLAEDLIASLGGGAPAAPPPAPSSPPAAAPKVASVSAVKPKKAPLDKNALPVKPEDLPQPQTFSYSSKAHVNESNTKDAKALYDFALKGNLTGLESYHYEAVNKETGAKAGMKPIAQHPSQHVQSYWSELCATLNLIANPPEALRLDGTTAKTLAGISDAFKGHAYGKTTASAPANKHLAYWIGLGKSDAVKAIAGAPGFAPLGYAHVPATLHKVTSAMREQAKVKHAAASTLAKKFMSGIQASGSYNDNFRDGKLKGTMTVKGTGETKSISFVEMNLEAHKHATEKPAGTEVYKWMNMSDAHVKALLAAPEGTVFQNPGSMCTSMNPTATSGFGQHRMRIRYAPGAKGVDSFASGSFKSEEEITTLPGSRFAILSAKEVQCPIKGKRLELDVLMLPPDPTYVADLEARVKNEKKGLK